MQYLKHLCIKTCEATAFNTDDESNGEEPLKEKGKEEVKPFHKLEVDFFQLQVYNAVAIKTQLSIYCSPTPPDYIQKVLVPPPNC